MEHIVGSNIGNYRERTVSGKKIGGYNNHIVFCTIYNYTGNETSQIVEYMWDKMQLRGEHGD